MLREHVLAALLGLLFLCTLSGHAQAQNLQLLYGERAFEIENRVFQGEDYYRLRDLLRVFSLSQQEVGNQLRLDGPRGTLTLIDSRPLVRSGDQYILLSSNVQRWRTGDWYVPRDFLEKALPNVLKGRLTRTGSDSYRVEALDETRVRVEVYTYPDRHSVVFRPSQSADGSVREFRNYLEVSFEESLIRPEFVQLPDQTELISSIDFTPQEGLGVFRIVKGPSYESFRDYQLSNPPRLVVDIYGLRPAEAEAIVTDRPETQEISPAQSEEDEDVSAETPPAESEGRQRVDLVIDPGHGGEQYGVDVQQNTLEKGITLNLSRLIESRLVNYGKDVELTRSRDVSLPVEQRSSVANFRRPRTFLSLHVGASSSPEVRGAVVYVYDPPQEAELEISEESPTLLEWDIAQTQYLSASQRLGSLLQNELNEFFECENQVISARLAVLAPIESPAVVVETGFLTNERDLELLSDPSFQQELADRIADVLDRFLNTL